MKREHLHKGDRIETLECAYIINGLHGGYNGQQHLDVTMIPYIFDDDTGETSEGEPEDILITNKDLSHHVKEMDGRNHDFIYWD